MAPERKSTGTQWKRGEFAKGTNAEEEKSEWTPSEALRRARARTLNHPLGQELRKNWQGDRGEQKASRGVSCCKDRASENKKTTGTSKEGGDKCIHESEKTSDWKARGGKKGPIREVKDL